MNSFHKKRLTFFSVLLCIVAIAIGMILYALKQNINVFFTPSELNAQKLAADYRCRLGGMVKKGSVIHNAENPHDLSLQFVVTDFKDEITVFYNGVLPDLFREGKGVIATGTLDNKGRFRASEVLAKHDENYTPKQMLNMQSKESA